MKRSIKGTDTFGTNQRLLDFILRYRSGGIASTNSGSFDSSITDKATGDMKKPGLRKNIEKRMMDAITKAFLSSDDIANVSSHRWQKKYTVQFDTFRILTSVMIRCSGDGLTSVGNYLINWVVHVAVNSLAKAIMTAYDWRAYTMEQFFEALPHIIESHKE